MLALLTLGIVKGNDWGWTSWEVLACFSGSALLFGLFVLSSRTHPSPLLDPTLMRIRPFAVGNTASVVAGMGFYAYLLTNILWLQYVWGTPAPLGTGARARSGGRGGARRGPLALSPSDAGTGW